MFRMLVAALVLSLSSVFVNAQISTSLPYSNSSSTISIPSTSSSSFFSSLSSPSLSSSSTASSAASTTSRGGAIVGPIPRSSTTIIPSTIPFTTTIQGVRTVLSATVDISIVVLVDSNGRISSTITRSTATQTASLSTLTLTSASSTITAGPSSTGALPIGAALSTSSVIVVVDSNGNPITPGASPSDRRTSTSQVIVTLYPSGSSGSGTGANLQGGPAPQLVGTASRSSCAMILVAVLGLVGAFLL